MNFYMRLNSIGVALATVERNSGPACVGPIRELIRYIVICHDVAQGTGLFDWTPSMNQPAME